MEPSLSVNLNSRSISGRVSMETRSKRVTESSSISIKVASLARILCSISSQLLQRNIVARIKDLTNVYSDNLS